MALTHDNPATNCNRDNRGKGISFAFKFMKTVNIQQPIGDNHSLLLFPTPLLCCLATTTKFSIDSGRLFILRDYSKT